VRGVITSGFLKKILKISLKCVQSVRVLTGIHLDGNEEDEVIQKRHNHQEDKLQRVINVVNQMLSIRQLQNYQRCCLNVVQKAIA